MESGMAPEEGRVPLRQRANAMNQADPQVQNDLRQTI
ncbi:hypothetical protein QE379_000078 [Sphingomonas sp. SORGH_AS 879]|nr:hypothetical protein [Sphingomonas sp. SORGH_AS_0879]